MIAREFTYTADRFDADVETQMATLEWFTTNANGSYKHIHCGCRMMAYPLA